MATRLEFEFKRAFLLEAVISILVETVVVTSAMTRHLFCLARLHQNPRIQYLFGEIGSIHRFVQAQNTLIQTLQLRKRELFRKQLVPHWAEDDIFS